MTLGMIAAVVMVATSSGKFSVSVTVKPKNPPAPQIQTQGNVRTVNY